MILQVVTSCSGSSLRIRSSTNKRLLVYVGKDGEVTWIADRQHFKRATLDKILDHINTFLYKDQGRGMYDSHYE